jgi:hypothetical protein
MCCRISGRVRQCSSMASIARAKSYIIYLSIFFVPQHHFFAATLIQSIMNLKNLEQDGTLPLKTDENLIMLLFNKMRCQWFLNNVHWINGIQSRAYSSDNMLHISYIALSCWTVAKDSSICRVTYDISIVTPYLNLIGSGPPWESTNQSHFFLAV